MKCVLRGLHGGSFFFDVVQRNIPPCMHAGSFFFDVTRCNIPLLRFLALGACAGCGPRLCENGFTGAYIIRRVSQSFQHSSSSPPLDHLLQIPAWGLYRGLYEMGAYAFLGVYRDSSGMQFDNLSDAGNGMLAVWGIFIVEAFLFMILGWYFEQVRVCCGQPRTHLSSLAQHVAKKQLLLYSGSIWRSMIVNHCTRALLKEVVH